MAKFFVFLAFTPIFAFRISLYKLKNLIKIHI